MINLLPPDIKQGYIYAQRNLKLLRWIVAFTAGLVGLGILGASGWLFLRQQATSYQSQIAAMQSSLQSEHFTETAAGVKDISNNFKLVVQVLSREVLFSQLLKQVAVTMPPGDNLTNLNISDTQGAVTITAEAVSYTAATQLQANLQDPANKIFAKADTQSVSCDQQSQSNDKGYPCVIIINALFAKNTPFLFINQGATP